MKRELIHLTNAEIQRGLNRQRHAEGLIKQLPEDHDGRNTWLLNFGIGKEAQMLRDKHNIEWDNQTQSAVTRGS